MSDRPATNDAMRRSWALCAKRLPTWDTTRGTVDMMYWYWGTLAIHALGGEPWAAWEDALQREVLPQQRTDGDACTYLGSWDPVGPWGGIGGRVYRHGHDGPSAAKLRTATTGRAERGRPHFLASGIGEGGAE